MGYKVARWSSFQTLTNDETLCRENHSLLNGSNELRRHLSNLWKSLIQCFSTAKLCVDSLGWREQQFFRGRVAVTHICSFADTVLSTVLINKHSPTHSVSQYLPISWKREIAETTSGSISQLFLKDIPFNNEKTNLCLKMAYFIKLSVMDRLY